MGTCTYVYTYVEWLICKIHFQHIGTCASENVFYYIAERLFNFFILFASVQRVNCMYA